jgi:hypothetical protein
LMPGVVLHVKGLRGDDYLISVTLTALECSSFFRP